MVDKGSEIEKIIEEKVDERLKQSEERIERLEKENQKLKQKLAQKNKVEEKEHGDKGVSRRGFLKGLGVLGVGVLAASSPVASRMTVTSNDVKRDGVSAFLDLPGSNSMTGNLDMNGNSLETGGSSISIYDTTNNQNLLKLNESGPVEVMNADLSMNGNPIRVGGNNIYGLSAVKASDDSLGDDLRIRTRGSDGAAVIQIYDDYNNQSLLRANEGGPVEIRNTDLQSPSITTNEISGKPVLTDWPAFRARFSDGEGGRELPHIQKFDAVEFDNSGDYDGTDTFTAPTNGIYEFHVDLREEEFYGEIGIMTIEFLVNGSVETATRCGLNQTEPHGQATARLKLNEGDNVQVQWNSSETSTACLETEEAWFEGNLITAV